MLWDEKALFFDRAVLVYAVDPALVEVDQEYCIVPKHRQPVHGRHLDDEGEQICACGRGGDQKIGSNAKQK